MMAFECEYCGETENLRIRYITWGIEPPSAVCRDCYTAPDDGPCFDDLLPVVEYENDNSQFGKGA